MKYVMYDRTLDGTHDIEADSDVAAMILALDACRLSWFEDKTGKTARITSVKPDEDAAEMWHISAIYDGCEQEYTLYSLRVSPPTLRVTL